MADRIVNEFGEGMEVELEHDFSAVSLDGPERDSQQCSDLFIRFPLGQQTDDFYLARSRSGACPLPLLMTPFCFEKSIENDFGYFGR